MPRPTNFVAFIRNVVREQVQERSRTMRIEITSAELGQLPCESRDSDGWGGAVERSYEGERRGGRRAFSAPIAIP